VIVEAGVNPDRMIAKGYGVSRPLPQGQNDMRVEVKVLGLPPAQKAREEDVPPPAPAAATDQVQPTPPSLERTKSVQQKVDVQENLKDLLQGSTTTWTYIVNKADIAANPGDKVKQSDATGEVSSTISGDNTTTLVVKSLPDQVFDTQRPLVVSGTTIPADDLVKLSCATVANVINFKPNTTIVLDECKYIVGKIARILNANPEIHVRVDGHVKMSRKSRANPDKVEQSIRLSNERAQHVMQELEWLGVNGKRMTAKGFGGTRPLPKGQNDKRVEVSVMGLNAD
jgi:outer membrane protein OmpA-like peptidoglycan-associated protein